MSHDFRFNRIDRPVHRPRVTEIRKVGATDQLAVIVLGTKVHGFGTHWDNGRTVPCTEDRKDCPRCEKQVPFKWVGFLHVYLTSVEEHYFLEMTDFAFARLEKLQGKRPDLRGLKLTVLRERKTIRAPLTFVLLGEASPASLMKVKERLPDETLKRIWNI